MFESVVKWAVCCFGIGVAVAWVIHVSLTGGFDHVDFFGRDAAAQLATARAEIALARAEHRAAMREIDKVKKDHKQLFMTIEEAYFGCHTVTRERKNEKAVPPVGRRSGR